MNQHNQWQQQEGRNGLPAANCREESQENAGHLPKEAEPTNPLDIEEESRRRSKEKTKWGRRLTRRWAMGMDESFGRRFMKGFSVKSFRMKVLLWILAFVAFFIGLLWLLQIAFLENYYEYAKEQTVKNTATQIEQLMKKYKFGELEDMIEEIAFDGNMCIEIRDMDGKSLFVEDMAGRDCVIHSNKSLLVYQLVNMFKQSENHEMCRVLTSYRFDSKSFLLIRQVKDFYGRDYLLWVSSPLLPVKSTTDILENQLILITIILLITGVILSMWMSNYITKPVEKISDASKAVAKGNYDVRVEAPGKDEIGEMAANFNYMVDELSKVDNTRQMLLANISHDLRTPLTMIKGYAETIKDLTGNDPLKREEQLDIIVREADRLSLLVDDVLSYTTMNQAGFELNKSPFDLDKTVSDIVERYKVISPGCRFIYESTGASMVYADSKRIEQVVYNLLNNAINHIGEDKQIIVCLDQGKFSTKVSVTDHGAGIPKEHLPFIWERYYKVNKSGKRATKGTGLGLSIIKTIMRAHYAPFGVDSMEGRGSTFWFELPLWYYGYEEPKRPGQES